MSHLKYATVAFSLSLLTLTVTINIGQAQVTEPPAETPAAGAASTDPAREAILKSGRWREAIYELNEWISVQQIYGEKEVEKLRAEWKADIDKMSADELETTLIRTERKLQILMSADALEARAWLAKYRARQAKYTDEQLRKKLPNVVTMSAAQLQAWLADFKTWRASRQTVHKSQSQIRAQTRRAVKEGQRSQFQAKQRAKDRSAAGTRNYGAPVRSNFTPRRYVPAAPVVSPFRGYWW